MRPVYVAIGLVATLLSTTSYSQESAGSGALSTLFDLGKDSKWLKTFTVEPKLLDAKEGADPSLGLGYKIFSRPLVKDWAGDAAPGQDPGRLAESLGSLEFSAKGMYATEAEVNVEKAVDATGAVAWTGGLYKPNLAFKTTIGGGYAQEQGNAKSDWRLEAAQTVGTVLTLLRQTHLIGRGAYARLDPIKDEARKAALAEEPKPYDRLELELLAIVPLNMGSLQKMELRFLGFKEPGAPSAVKTAGLDESALWSVYFALPNNMFVAYSKGGVPSDRQDSKVLQIGWSSRGF
jgi:hypothetical protein